MKWLISLLACVLVLASAAADDFMVAYRAYGAALEAGDGAEAIKQSKRAWETAKTQGVDAETLAILGLNYASLIYPLVPDQAIAPLEYAVRAPDPAALFGDEDPALMLAYARAASGSNDKAARQALKDAIEARADMINQATEVLHARAHLLLGESELQEGDARGAREELTRSLELFAPYQRNLSGELAKAEHAMGLSYMAERRKLRKPDIEQAFSHFDQARSNTQRFNPDGTFNQLHAGGEAWTSALQALYQSRFNQSLPSQRAPGQMADTDGKEDCEVTPIQRDTDYPLEELERGSFGAAVVVFDLNREGRTENIRLLSEVPSVSLFGEAAVENVARWTYEVGADASDACIKNQWISVQYYLQD